MVEGQELVRTPNPVKEAASIEFGVDRLTPVTLSIYTIAGRYLRSLVRGSTSTGVHQVVWDGRDDQGQEVATGIYVIQLRTGSRQINQKVVLSR